MRVTVLAVEHCPNAVPAMQRATAALAGHAAQVELIEVHDEEQAARLGMNGSPTILVDGADPFATHGTAPSLSCRLYREPDGAVAGVPSLAALNRVLEGPTYRPRLGDAGE